MELGDNVAEHELDAPVAIQLLERGRQLGMAERCEEPLAGLDHRHLEADAP